MLCRQCQSLDGETLEKKAIAFFNEPFDESDKASMGNPEGNA
jgi:hypothetical protein